MSSSDALSHTEQLERLHALATTSLGRYDLPEGATAQLINLSENATYRIDGPGAANRWALRVHREGYHSTGAIASELAWMTDLRESGSAITPTAIAGKDGALIQTVEDPALPQPRRVVLFQWEEGVEPNEDRHDLPASFEVLGETAARMHLHVRGWTRPDDFERFTWDFETSLGATPHWGSWRDGMGMTHDIEKLFERTVALIEERLNRFGKSRERFDLVHCDMRLANLLIDGDVTKVIDFDDCGFSWLLYDCATTVSFFEHRPEVPGLLKAWTRGYRKVMDLSAEDEHEIQTFVMLRRLLLVAWIGSHSETDLAQSMGVNYTRETVPLCERYLTEFA